MKITIAGDAVVLTSALKLGQLETISKYRPKSLTLMGGENNKEEVFKVGVGARGTEGSVSKYGATFTSETHDAEKLACITMNLTGATGDIKEYVADKLGAAVINLNKLEAAWPAVLAEIEAEKAQVLSNITVAQ